MTLREILVPIPRWDEIKIYLFAAYFSAWIFFRRIFTLLWHGEFNSRCAVRDNPPHTLSELTTGKHSFVKVKGVKLHFVELGEKAAPPILLLHGFPDCWVGWKEQLTLLSTSYHVIAVDLKGFGDSDKPGMRFQYRLPQLIGEMSALLSSICDNSTYNNVTLLGHDLGGLLGWFLLYNSPALIRRFISVSAPHPNVFWDLLQNSSPLNKKWMHITQTPWLAEEEAMKCDMAFLEKCGPHLAANPSLLETYKYVFSRHEDWTGPMNYYRNLMLWRIKGDCDLIDKPTVLIIGNKDPQISLEAMVRSSEFCNNATVKIIDGAGHFPHQEDPDNFNLLLEKLLIGERKKLMAVKNISENFDNNKGLVGRLLGAVNIFS